MRYKVHGTSPFVFIYFSAACPCSLQFPLNIYYIVADGLSVCSVRFIITFYQIRFLLSCFGYMVKYVELPCYLRSAESPLSLPLHYYCI
jgi:hypothetical protein